MKTKIFSILLSVAAMAGFSACDTWNPDMDVNGMGQLRTSTLGVDVDGAETVVADNSTTTTGAAKASKASASRATVDLTNFIVTVANSKGQQVSRWTYATMPELPTFAAGDYTVTVRSHEVEPAAWNAPYYEGSQSFTIETDKVTEVQTVVCTLSNIRVSVHFTEALMKAFDNPDEVTVKVTSEGNNSLVFTPAETRSGYFAALKDLETLRIDFSASIMGYTETFTKTIDNVAKGQYRKITFGLSGNDTPTPEELGTVINDGQGITVNTAVIEDAPIETDYEWYEDNIDNTGRPGDEDFEQGGGDDPDPPTPPTPPVDDDQVLITFDSPSLDLEGMNDATSFPDDCSKPAAVDISAEKGIANLVVEIISNSLNAEMLEGVGLTQSFDLAYPGDLDAALSTPYPDGFGFPTGSNVIGQTKVTFDIAPFVPLLNIYPGEVHQFKITVKDQIGKEKVLTLKFQS